jgi:hypothetical protein
MSARLADALAGVKKAKNRMFALSGGRADDATKLGGRGS